MKNVRNDFIALDELGVDTSDYKICTATYADTFYKLYCSSCQNHEQNSKDYSEDYEIGKKIANLTASGIIGTFRWYALTTYYGTDIYKKTKDRELQNSIHRETMQRGSYALGEILNHAINSSEDMHSLLRDPFVLSTKNLMGIREYSFLSALQNHVENFMELPHIDAVSVINEKIIYNWSLLRAKDVIIPFVIGSQRNIDKFAEIASLVCGPNKASCAIGLFITRIKPSLDGRETKIVDSNDRIPIISENPFFTPIV